LGRLQRLGVVQRPHLDQPLGARAEDGAQFQRLRAVTGDQRLALPRQVGRLRPLHGLHLRQRLTRLGDLLGAHVGQRRRLEFEDVDAAVGQPLDIDGQSPMAGGKLAEDGVELLLDRLHGVEVFGVQPIQFGDDTKVKLRVVGASHTKKAHLWVYVGDADFPYVVFDFTVDYTAEGPQQFLKGYKGYLQ